jgi:hypothetical protein
MGCEPLGFAAKTGLKPQFAESETDEYNSKGIERNNDD